MKTKHILSAIFACISISLFAENVPENKDKGLVLTEIATNPKAAETTNETLYMQSTHRGGDGYDDEFTFSRRIRRFHNHPNGGASQQSWSYYDPYYSSDIYYTVNTPAWNSYYYGSFYNTPMTTVVVRPTFWGVVAAILFAPTYYNYGYYNPSPVGWGYYGGQGYYNGWNQCYWGGASYGYGYYGGYNSGFYNGYNQGYNNGYYNGYNNGYNQGYYDGFNNGVYSGGGYNNGDDWWYWKNQNPTPRPTLSNNGTVNAVSHGGRGEIGVSQTSIVKPSKGEIGVQPASLGNRPVTSPANASMNTKPTTEPVRNGGVKWDSQTGDEPVRNQTQTTKPTWSSEPSRPNTTSPIHQGTSTRPQETVGARPQTGTMPSAPARPQTQINGNRPESNPSGFPNVSRPNTNFDNRPNKPSYENQQSNPYNSGNHTNPTTPGRSNGDRSDYNPPRTPQNGYNSGTPQNQPSMSRPQPQTAPSRPSAPAPARTNTKSNEGSVKFPAPTGRKGGLSYTPSFSIVP